MKVSYMEFVGTPGTGKTTICNNVLESLRTNANMIIISKKEVDEYRIRIMSIFANIKILILLFLYAKENGFGKSNRRILATYIEI